MKKYILGILVVFTVGILLTVGSRTMANRENEVTTTVNTKQPTAQSPEPSEMAFRIGIFPPGFTKEADETLAHYKTAWSGAQVEKRNYKGYTLIIPPDKLAVVEEAEREIDTMIKTQKAHIPSSKQQQVDRAAIEKLFGTETSIVYDEFSGKYLDDNGYQYTVSSGRVIGKSIGVTATLQEKWQLYMDETERMPAERLTTNATRISADRFIARVGAGFDTFAQAEQVKVIPVDDEKIAFNYGEIQILVNRKNGEVIHFSVNDSKEEVKQ